MSTQSLKESGENFDTTEQIFHTNPNKNDPRHTIQSCFRTHYGLELSVRPPRIRGYIDDVPYMIVYAQVQSGGHSFAVHPKSGSKKWLEKVIK
jgi:hypothetical protein